MHQTTVETPDSSKATTLKAGTFRVRCRKEGRSVNRFLEFRYLEMAFKDTIRRVRGLRDQTGKH